MTRKRWIAYLFFAVLAFVFAMRAGLLHFPPSAEWTSALIWPARLAAALGAVFGVVAGFAATSDTKNQSNAKAAGGAVFFAVVGALACYFVATTVFPMLIVVVSGRPVAQDVLVATNVFGSGTDGKWCRGGLYVNDGDRRFDPASAREVCLDASGRKNALMTRQMQRGETEAVVTLHGWGNSVGIIYWSVDVPEG